MNYTTIKINKMTKKKLERLKKELEREIGKKISYDDLIRILIQFNKELL